MSNSVIIAGLATGLIAGCSGEYIAYFPMGGKYESMTECKKRIYQRRNAYPNKIAEITIDNGEEFTGFYEKPRSLGPIKRRKNDRWKGKLSFSCTKVTDPTLANEYVKIPHYQGHFYKWGEWK